MMGSRVPASTADSCCSALTIRVVDLPEKPMVEYIWHLFQVFGGTFKEL